MFYERLKRLGFDSYNAYLKSRHWKDLKIKYESSGRPRQCILCDRLRYQLHHISYVRLGEETLNDLVPLCSGCHHKIHDFHKRRRTELHSIVKGLRKIGNLPKAEIKHRLKRFRTNGIIFG